MDIITLIKVLVSGLLNADEVNELSVEMKKTVPRENDHRRIFSIIQLVFRFFKFRYFQSVPELQGSSVP